MNELSVGEVTYSSASGVLTGWKEQVKKATESLSRVKAADIYGGVAQHVLYGGDLLLQILTNIMNSLFSIGSIQDSLKAGV